ncbi:MAG: (Fe-S)-binding protein [Thermodesulfobacteriota bacterium]
MLLHDYQLRIVLPECNFSAEKVNAIVTLSDDISEVLPYLNRTLKGLHYIDHSKVLTIKMEGHLVTFRPREIAITKLEDEKEAKAVMEKLKRIINETYDNRDRIEPDYNTAKELKSGDVIKLLPGTNCKECGERTCFAFAFKLIRHEVEISKCKPLFSEGYEERRKALFELIETSGYEIPEA